MDAFDKALAEVAPAAQVIASYDGFTAGLNASERKARAMARLYLLRGELALGTLTTKYFVVRKGLLERIPFSEIMSVEEAEVPITGLAGYLSTQNARTVPGKVIGLTNTQPAIIVQTRRGDFIFTFNSRKRGECRKAYLAITEQRT